MQNKSDKIDHILSLIEEQAELVQKLEYHKDTKFLRKLIKAANALDKETEKKVIESAEKNVDFYIQLHETMNSLIQIYTKKP